MGEVPKEGFRKGGWVHRKNRLKSDRYHYNQDRERNQIVEVPNKGVSGTYQVVRVLGYLLMFVYRCCLMRYHSKGYQQGLQGCPTM
jgi:hypothetical protein